MSAHSIARVKLVNQVPKDGSELMRVAALSVFVRDLISENAIYRNGGLSLFVCELSRVDQKLFLSNVIDAEEFEWLCENETRLDAGIKEYERHMQSLIDEKIDEVWHEAMQEAGNHWGTHSDNGEGYYYR